MTRPATPHVLGLPARFFLAAVVAVGILFGVAATASATSAPAAENAVGPSSVAVASVVGSLGDVSPANSRETYDSQAVSASATGVAADSGLGLADDVARNFKGGNYTASVTTEDVLLTRYSGGTSPTLGPWWTRTTYSSSGRAQQYLALPPGNTATTATTIRVPSGTTIFEGQAAAQPQWGALGGGNQIYIPQVDPAWIVP